MSLLMRVLCEMYYVFVQLCVRGRALWCGTVEDCDGWRSVCVQLAAYCQDRIVVVVLGFAGFLLAAWCLSLTYC